MKLMNDLATPPVGLPRPALDPTAAIIGATREACRCELGGAVRALILTGSLARDEGTFVAEGGHVRVLGDAEFVMVMADTAPVPAESELRRLEATVAARLAPSIDCPVSVAAVRTGYLRGLPPHIFGYELRACGRVVDGDEEVLALVPPFGTADIPREDAWCMLGNRMIEYLAVAGPAVSLCEPVPPAVRYRTAKLCLDLATSWLVFVDAYRPTYRERAGAVSELAARGTAAPFGLEAFAADVALCTAYKLSGRGEPGVGLVRRTLTYTRALWRWELAQLTGGESTASAATLLRSWMRRQRVRARLRGWAYVAVQERRRASTLTWARWLRQAWLGSPRYCVYAAAAALFFILADPTVTPAAREEESRRLRRLLPVVGTSGPRRGEPEWRRVAADVIWNYRQFLVGTRA